MNDRVKDSRHRQSRDVFLAPLRHEFNLDVLFSRYDLPEPHKALGTSDASATDTGVDSAPLTQDAAPVVAAL